MSGVNVVIVEDDSRYRESLETLFRYSDGFELVASFGRATAAVAQARRIAAGEAHATWDLVFIDIDLGEDMSGIEGAREFKRLVPDAAVLMITTFEEPATVLQAICAGADGYLLKRTSAQRILEQARSVVAGDAPMAPSVARTVLELMRLGLSAQERDVLRELADGNSYMEVTAALGIKLDAVRSHVRQLYEKLRAHSAAEPVARAIRGA